jgi:ketosteroid isomerase-like protein
MKPEQVFNLFIDAINRHDVSTLTSLMTPNISFIDSLGNSMVGAAAMEAGWRGYFTMCHDYWIRIAQLMSNGVTVLATGEAGGTINSIEWRTPAAWKAEIREDKMAEWQVFADNKPVYEILAKR